MTLRQFFITVVFLCLCASSGVAGADPVAVETFTGAGTVTVTLPGSTNNGVMSFSAARTVTSLSFPEGSVQWNGKPVDFYGKEADFIAGTYAGTASAAIEAVPTTVDDITVSGSATIDTVTKSISGTISGVPLGAGFTAGNLDLVVDGSDPSGEGTMNCAWDLNIVPNLTGAAVSVAWDGEIVSVDAASGIVDLSETGTIFAALSSQIPALSTWGLLLFTIGLLGSSAVVIIRRRRVHPVSV